MSNFALGSPVDETFRVNRQIVPVDRNIEALFTSVDSAVVLVQSEAESDMKESLRTSWTERKAKVDIDPSFPIGTFVVACADFAIPD